MSFRALIISLFLVFSLSGCGAMSTTWDWFSDDEEIVVTENSDEEMMEEEFQDDFDEEFKEELNSEFDEEFDSEFGDEFQEELGENLSDEEFKEILEEEYGDEPIVEQDVPTRMKTPPRATVYFDYKSVVVSATGLNLLQLHAQNLINNPGLTVTLVGHSDKVASGSYNRKLSLKRAQAVAEILVQMGTNPSQIEIISRGESELAVEGDSEYANAMNRRVELVYN